MIQLERFVVQVVGGIAFGQLEQTFGRFGIEAGGLFIIFQGAREVTVVASQVAGTGQQFALFGRSEDALVWQL